MQVTLLGTGCPIVDIHRYGPATLVEAGGEAWLIDCGSGVTQRLLAHGRSGAHLTGLLLTHLHSDHVVDFIQLLISGWHQGRKEPLRVYGPRRTREFINTLLQAWQPEFEQRAAYEFRSLEGLKVDVEEIDGNWSLRTPWVKITATEVWHQPIPQAFGFRFDMPGASTVISGDTTKCPALIELATGCDLLVHEVFVHWQFERDRPHAPPQQRRNIRAYHTTTVEVGQVAAEAEVRHLALTHWVPTVFDAERVTRDVRTSFDGGLYLGEDLMSFAINDGAVYLMRNGISRPA